MKKHEIAVFIENEEMLREASNVLIKNCQHIDKDMFDLNISPLENYLLYSEPEDVWFISFFVDEVILTLPQLEEILKNQ
jgi:hypothetical protein